MDASNLLKPALARGELHCVGATTLDEYRKHVEKDAALARRFQPVFVDEPTVEDTVSILRGLKEKYEQHHGVRITDSAPSRPQPLSNRYITDRFLPDKAIDLVDEASSRAAHAGRFEARGTRQSRPRDRAPEDRGGGPQEGDRRRLQGSPPAAREGARGPRGAIRAITGAGRPRRTSSAARPSSRSSSTRPAPASPTRSARATGPRPGSTPTGSSRAREGGRELEGDGEATAP